MNPIILLPAMDRLVFFNLVMADSLEENSDFKPIKLFLKIGHPACEYIYTNLSIFQDVKQGQFYTHTHTHTHTHIYIYIYIYIALMPLEKVLIQLSSDQLWADWAF